MRDHEQAMLVYVQLAELSQQKRQLPGCDKFLLLAGVSACCAGWPEVARRCRELVLAHNHLHLIGKFETFADALRDPEFKPFVKRLERFCPYEKAEYLLKQLDTEAGLRRSASVPNAGQYALELLADEASEEP